MQLIPSHRAELRVAVAQAMVNRRPIKGWDLRRISSVLAYTPEDMTITVESGMTLESLQQVLAAHRQWVPVDPAFGAIWSLERILAEDVSGPHRFGYGTLRDHVIGLRAILADGREIHSGGNVVKNVAGYDLHKLMIGARGSLGIIVEVTFKLMPIPESRAFFTVACMGWEEMRRRLDSVWNASFQPVVFDLYRLESAMTSPVLLVIGLAGAREDVERQSAWAVDQGFRSVPDLGYETDFWGAPEGPHPLVGSVLPSNLVSTLQSLGEGTWISRAGNGAIFHRPLDPGKKDALARPPGSAGLKALAERIKWTFDPQNIFPPIPQ